VCINRVITAWIFDPCTYTLLTEGERERGEVPLIKIFRLKIVQNPISSEKTPQGSDAGEFFFHKLGSFWVLRKCIFLKV